MPVLRPFGLLLLLAAVGGCRIASAAEVALPTSGPTFRVTCRYELANCLRYAQKHCREGFEQITRKSCPQCGRNVPIAPLTEPPIQKPGFEADLYYRCMGNPAPRARR